MALPEYGLSAAVRVCDCCYYELGFRGVGEVETVMARSYHADRVHGSKPDDVNEGSAAASSSAGEQSAARGRSDSSRRRGSSVVDELVQNIKSL
jgi:hypothetical protein